MTTDSLPAVLCVDDDPRLLQGLSHTLRKHVRLTTALGAAEALEKLPQLEGVAVIVSDMRMPGMDGATFLAHVKTAYPDAVRVLLTGESDMASAIKAVNEGQIFRFLTKPCPPDVLISCLQSAVEQHRLITAERELLEKTVRGSISALTDLLAIVNPEAFGRATRIKRRAAALATVMKVREVWPIEVAGMLSQIGYVILPPATAEKLHTGRSLTPEERTMVDKVPDMTQKILGNIPRLEPVLEILSLSTRRFDGQGAALTDGMKGTALPLGARILRIIIDFDALDDGKRDRPSIVRMLRMRAGLYDPDVLTVLETAPLPSAESGVLAAVGLNELVTGMVLADDVRTTGNMLLIARGNEITPGGLERLRNFALSARIREPIHVFLPS